MIQAKLYLVAGTETYLEDVASQLHSEVEAWFDMRIESGEELSAADLLTEFGGKLCYQSFSTGMNANLTRANTRNNFKYVQESIVGQKHGSVLEHSSFSILIENVSRVVTHELVRHRAGTAFSQESGRYVRISSPDIYVPQCIKDAGEKALVPYLKQAASAYETIKELEEILEIDKQSFERKKEITSALRRLAPTGSPTTLLMTANVRAWRHIIELRTAPGAEEEFRSVMNDAYYLLRWAAPAAFADGAVTGQQVLFYS